ncbi:MAG: tetratricopeptide repeat protein [bacterium]|nr:tetratricopeptide repeat protein [bacterium]
MESLNINIVIILVAFIAAVVAIILLYSIIMPKGTITEEDRQFQLTTKNIVEHVKTLFEKGEYALVQLLAIKYLERMPSHVEVRRYLAKAYHANQRYNNSIKQCSMILKKNSEDIEIRKLLADCFVQKGFYTKAISEYEAVYENNSSDRNALRELARLYRETEEYRYSIEAYNVLVGLVESNEEKAEIQKTLAELNEEIHDYPAAFQAYKARLEIYPTDVETNQNLAKLYIALNNYQKAIETLLYTLEYITEPKMFVWTYEQLVNMYSENGDYEKAIEYSNKLLDTQGVDKFKVRRDIALLNLKLDNYNDGISILEELTMISQSSFDVTTELAKAYINQKKYEEALEKYNVLLDKSTQKEAKEVRILICDLYITWAIANAEEKDYASSYKHLDMATEYNVLNPEIYYYKALNNYEQKNYSAGINLLNQAIEYDKTKEHQTKYLLKLAETHHALNHYFEEKKALSDLLKLDPNNASGLYYYGLMYVSQHDVKNAEEYFNKALIIDPTLVQAKYNLALLYEINNVEKAKELYREVLEEDPNFMEARNALTDLTSIDY